MAGNVSRHIKSGNSHVDANRYRRWLRLRAVGLARPTGERARRRAGRLDLTGLFGSPRPSCLTTDATSSPYFVWNGECQVRIRPRSISEATCPRMGGEVRVQINSPFGNNCNGGLSARPTNGVVGVALDHDSGRVGRNVFYLAGRPALRTELRQMIQMAFASNTDAASLGLCISPDDLCDDHSVLRPGRRPTPELAWGSNRRSSH